MAVNDNAQLMCDNCGGILDIDPEKATVVCSFCGSCFSVSELLNESERIKIERIRRDVELGRQNLELERMRQAEAIRNENIRRTEASKKSLISKISIVFAVISLLMCVSAFMKGALLTGCIAAIQFILFTVVFLMGKRIAPAKTKKSHALLFAVALLLEIPFSMSVATNEAFQSSKNNDIIAWDEIVLGDRIPELDSESGYISKNTRYELMMNVYGVPLKRYYDFVEDCKEMGYTVGPVEDDKSYRADAQDGFTLYVHYSVLHDGNVDVNLFAPKAETTTS